MKKEFYIGQPLIIKKTGEKVTFVNYDGDTNFPCSVLQNDGRFYPRYFDYHELEPSTEFKFSEIIAGMEQGYFKIGTEFTMTGYAKTIKVVQGNNGLSLERFRELLFLESKDINSTWTLVEPRKEMTLDEVEAELGYKIKLKNYA